MKNLSKAALLVPVLLLALAAGLRAQTVVDGFYADGTNPTAYFQFNTTPGNAIVAVAGCSTSAYACNPSIPTDQDHDKFTQVAMCTATAGTAVRSIVYVAFNIVGGDLAAVHSNGTGLQMVILELHGVNAVDAAGIACGTGSLPRGGTATSGNVTTTRNNELVVGLGTAACPPLAPLPNFAAYGSGWNTGAGLIGSQVAERQVLATPATVAATATVQCNGDPTESYALAIVSFYQSPSTVVPATVSSKTAAPPAPITPAIWQFGLPISTPLSFFGSIFGGYPAHFGSTSTHVGTPANFSNTMLAGPPTDGAIPRGGLVIDGKGNLYGTTVIGGANGLGIVGNYLTVSGYGSVIKVASNGTESALYSFKGGTDAANPYAGLIVDNQGNLYGTSTIGGSSSCGCGTVFKVAPNGTETVLYSFKGGTSDGAFPYGTLVMDQQGNLYGTTEGGGTADNAGTVFKLDPYGHETVLHHFNRALDGANPYAGLISDGRGNLYGTALIGGVNNFGTVFQLNTSGTGYTVLHTFMGGKDGAQPYAGLATDQQGNLYGTTLEGGVSADGTIFKIACVHNTESILYSFQGGTTDGSLPHGTLIIDPAGNLYGTTLAGGTSGDGTAYELTAGGTETLLQSFTGGSDGGYPYAGLVMDSSYNLYGTAQYGGNVSLNSNFGGGVLGDGTLFSIANPFSSLIELVQQYEPNPLGQFVLVLTLQSAQYQSLQGNTSSMDQQLKFFISEVLAAETYKLISTANGTTLINQANGLM